MVGIRAVVVCLVLVACKKAEPPGPPLVTRIPHVDAVEVLAAAPVDTLPPPVVVLVDAAGKLGIAAGPAKWSGLAAYAPPAKPRAVTEALLDRLVLESAAFGKRARDELRSIARLEREMAEADKQPPPEDEPPPEPPEPAEDEVEEEDLHGGHGMPMPPEKPRPPPTYRGRHTDFAAGFRYGVGPGPPGHPVGSSTLRFPEPRPERFASVIGEPLPAVLAAQAVIAVDPRAKGVALVRAVQHTEGSLLVEAGGTVRVLRVQFMHDVETNAPPGMPFIDVRASVDGIEVEGVPSPATKLGWDLPAVAKTIAALVAQPHFKTAHVDIIVGEGVTAQQLVDLLVAVDRIGVPGIGIGELPQRSASGWAVRGTWKRTVRIEPEGEREHRRVVTDAKPKLRTCYDDALVGDPTIAGEGSIVVAIDAKGVVTATNTTLPPVVGDCMTAAIKGLAFPKGVARLIVNVKLRPYP